MVTKTTMLFLEPLIPPSLSDIRDRGFVCCFSECSGAHLLHATGSPTMKKRVAVRQKTATLLLVPPVLASLTSETEAVFFCDVLTLHSCEGGLTILDQLAQHVWWYQCNASWGMARTTNEDDPCLAPVWLNTLALTMVCGFMTQHRTGNIAGWVPTSCCVFLHMLLWQVKLIVKSTLWTLTTAWSVC